MIDPAEGQRRRQFTLKDSLAVVMFAAVVLGSFRYLYLHWKPSESLQWGDISRVVVRLNPDDPVYVLDDKHLGLTTGRILNWLDATTVDNSSARPVFQCKVIFEKTNGRAAETLHIDGFSCQKTEGSVLVEWRGQIRSGDLKELRTIVLPNKWPFADGQNVTRDTEKLYEMGLY